MTGNVLNTINDAVWGWTLLMLILGVGVFLTVRTRFVQVRGFRRALRLIRHGETGEDGISAFSVVCTALSAAIGTGNIIGVATAVAAGGPGALFWMVVSAVLGMAVKYAEGVLAVKYRVRDGDGYVGGPFYYIERGMGHRFRWLGKLYAAFGAAAGLLGMGTLTQSNSITAAVQTVTKDAETLSFGEVTASRTTVVVGLIVTVAAALVILGGMRRITSVATVLVPFMLGIYTLSITLILLTNINKIPSAFSLILRAAFAPRAALGAAAGITVKSAVRFGVGRGIFSNEAGMGTEAIAAAAARTNSPRDQGLVCMVSTAIDTVILCTVAGLVLIVTGAYQQPHLSGMAMTTYAWETGLPWSGAVSSWLLTACLVFFAFSTILGWNFYAEQCMRYLCDGRGVVVRAYRVLYIVAVLIGPYVSAASVWTVADICNGCMIFPNMVALLSLGGVVIRESTVCVPLHHPKNQKNHIISRISSKILLDGRQKG